MFEHIIDWIIILHISSNIWVSLYRIEKYVLYCKFEKDRLVMFTTLLVVLSIHMSMECGFYFKYHFKCHRLFKYILFFVN